MNRRTAVLALWLAVGLVSGAAAPAWADAPSQPSAAARAALTKVLAASVDRGDTPGVVALVVNREGTLFESAAGKLSVAGNQPMPTNAIFNIASMTKPVTSVAIMMLMEQGKLGLDDPVSKFLPGFENLKVIKSFNAADGTYESQPAAHVMTVRHLLAHTSGLGYAFSNAIVRQLQEGNQKLEWEFPLLSDPGTQWNYSASTRVLGLIVEKISGQSIEAFDQQHIFKPLGMNDTSYAVPASKQARVPTLHRMVDGKRQEGPQTGVPATATGPFRGDGGLYSTAHDYGQFMRMFLNGGRLGTTRILSERSVRLMGENQIGAIFVERQAAAIPALTQPFPLGAGRDKFGLGFQIAAADPAAAGFRSPGSLSWAGLYNTEFWIDPSQHVAAVVLMQVLPFYDDGAIRTLRDFEAAVYQQLTVR